MPPSSTEALDAALRRSISELSGSQGATAPWEPDNSGWWGVFAAQAGSRWLDVVARELQARGEGFYTIGSAGHESNALVAAALRPTDPALLHYRSGAFYLTRAAQVPGSTGIRDVLQGLMGLADEPIAGGRHKVFGHRALHVIPQTSTIASHLPRAVGLALALHRAQRLGVETDYPDDAVVVCSFGDASANHSTAVGAVNTALNAAFRGLPVPILFVCEDNGLGISVPTPRGWIETAYGHRPGLRYDPAEGSNPVAARAAIRDAVAHARSERTPVFLHLRTVRYLGHAGSDAEISYRKPSTIEADYAHDPLLGTARALVEGGTPPERVLDQYDQIGDDVRAEAERLAQGRRLGSAVEVVEPLAPRRPDIVAAAAARLRPAAPQPASNPQSAPRQARGEDAESSAGGVAGERPRTLAESINVALGEILAADPRVLLFGEDVGVKGGVYGVTRGLQRRFGTARVFDTVLDEQSILGLGLGAGLAGLIPIPEIQYLAYLHNAEDQLRGEAATLRFFSSGAYANPMVVRVAGLAYQRGFGGHFHNDNAVGVLRDIPGLVVGCPARGDDAAAMLRTCVAAAITDGTVSVFLEPIALYHARDLHSSGDGQWLAVDHGTSAPVGHARRYRVKQPRLTMITFGNGVAMSLRVANRLSRQGIRADVVDLRWLAPLPVADVLEAAAESGRVLVVDETRHGGGVGEGVITALVENGFTGPIARVAAQDSFVPLGRAAEHVLLSEAEIDKAAITLAERNH
jgi:2-oxoisovalerate dehydrogenase E1 component